MYEDDAELYHYTRTVEVYLPWSDTWFNLPTLPTFSDVDGTQYNITAAQIFSILTSNSYQVYLMGGVNYDINRSVVKPTKQVYRLEYNGTFHYWNHDSAIVPDMGK